MNHNHNLNTYPCKRKHRSKSYVCILCFALPFFKGKHTPKSNSAGFVHNAAIEATLALRTLAAQKLMQLGGTERHACHAKANVWLGGTEH